MQAVQRATLHTIMTPTCPLFGTFMCQVKRKSCTNLLQVCKHLLLNMNVPAVEKQLSNNFRGSSHGPHCFQPPTPHPPLTCYILKSLGETLIETVEQNQFF